jgi:hypothetical protein
MILNDLSNIIIKTAEDCSIYNKLCKESEYDFDETLKDSNLDEIPYIPWSFFKLSNNRFKDLLRGRTFENLKC